MSNRRIMVVDDEEDILEVAQVSLEMLGGWNVLTARSGSEALAKAETEQPEAILLDVMMPHMDGPTTLRKLQNQAATRGIPVILLTAKVQAADHNRFVQLGVSGVITKPFDPLELPHQVAKILGWQCLAPERVKHQ